MRTATRIALMLTGTAILIAAMATPGARANRGRMDDDGIRTTTAEQRAQRQARPGRIDYVLARKTVRVATAVEHFSDAPVVANLDRGEEWMLSEVASASKSDRVKKKSVAVPTNCDHDTFASQQLNASDGGRGSIATSLGDASCPPDDTLQHRTRQVLLDETVELDLQRSEPAPALIKFHAVISINMAALKW